MPALPFPRYTAPYNAGRRIIVIGGVAAGPAAAARAARVDPEAEVLLFEEGGDISYGVCELPYLVSGELFSPDELVVHTPSSLNREKRVHTFTRHRVLRIHAARRTVDVLDLETASVRSERYDRLILTTGSRSVLPPGLPTGAENVHTLKTLEDARRLCGSLDATSRPPVCVIGGGYIGVEAAEAFHARGCPVTMVTDDDLPMPGWDAELRHLLLSVLEKHGITVRTGFRVDGCLMQGTAVTAVSSAGVRIEADLFLVATGIEPVTGLASEAGIRLGSSGGIRVDSRQSTSMDGIFAAGDCAETVNLVTGKPALFPFASLAYRTGHVAGENAAGGSASFKGTVPLAAVHVFGHEFAQAGMSPDDCVALHRDVRHASVTSTSRVRFMPDAQPILVTLTADTRTRRLLGGGIAGMEHAAQRANMIAFAIRHGVTVDAFLDTDFVYTPRLAPLQDPLITCARALRSRL